MRSIHLLPVSLLAFGLLLPAAPVQAQMDPATQRLIDQLRPQSQDALNATRGLRRPPSAPSESPAAPAVTLTPAAPAPQPPPRPAPAAQTARPSTTAPAGMPSASLTVNFATGSDELTPSAMRELDRLGRALTSADLAPYRFRIEGHTDTVGAASLNQALSERRAAAVGRYLTQRFGVDSGRLETIGLGQTQLLVPTPDNTPSAENRRVQVINLGR